MLRVQGAAGHPRPRMRTRRRGAASHRVCSQPLRRRKGRGGPLGARAAQQASPALDPPPSGVDRIACFSFGVDWSGGATEVTEGGLVWACEGIFVQQCKS
jgi:hypothetical protein